MYTLAVYSIVFTPQFFSTFYPNLVKTFTTLGCTIARDYKDTQMITNTKYEPLARFKRLK